MRRGDCILLVVGCVVVLGCSQGRDAGPMAQPSGSAAASARPSASPSALPGVLVADGALAAEKVAKVLNPKGVAPYAGPTGTVRGVIRVKGDPPPDRKVKLTEGCPSVADMYGKLFRVGKDGELADALVAVTGYDGFVPPAKPSVSITVKDCAFSTRTVAMAYGQVLEVANVDRSLTYLPQLVEARVPATLVAMPHGDPVRLHAPEPRLYRLIDMQGRTFMVADVFVLKFSTLTVTGLDGRYEIPGVPVGPVEVSAMLPAARLRTTNARIEVKPGDNPLDLTIEFDAKRDTPPQDVSPPTSASAP